MNSDERVNILLVDDQPAKLLAYEVILKELDETLIIISSDHGDAQGAVRAPLFLEE